MINNCISSKLEKLERKGIEKKLASVRFSPNAQLIHQGINRELDIAINNWTIKINIKI